VAHSNSNKRKLTHHYLDEQPPSRIVSGTLRNRLRDGSWWFEV